MKWVGWMPVVIIALAASRVVGASSLPAAEPAFAISVQFMPPERSALVVQAMIREASAIWAPYGIRFDWSTDGAASASADVEGSFDVEVHSTRGHPSDNPGSMVLGRTRLPRTSIDHAPVLIDRDGIDTMLSGLHTDRLLAVAGHQTVGATDFGRAIGRVLAHEIGHVLLAQAAHRHDGLMRAEYVPEDLVALRRDSFTLSRVEVERLYVRLDALRSW